MSHSQEGRPVPRLAGSGSLVCGGSGHTGRRADPVAGQAGFAGVQDCFEHEGELLQRDIHQLSCNSMQHIISIASYI